MASDEFCASSLGALIAFASQVTYLLTAEMVGVMVAEWLQSITTNPMMFILLVMLLLIANDAPLGPEWKDHPLKGEWASFRECNIGGDFLLIYRLDDGIGVGGGIVFTRIGTHSELFRE